MNQKDIDRFWAKVDTSGSHGYWNGTPCLIWTAATTKGYGRIFDGRKPVYAHRFAWTITNGNIPDELQVLHHCDTPLCVQVHHLFIGTSTDNMRDMTNKGRNIFQRIGFAVGVNNARAVLTDDKVREMRKLKASGVSYAELGRRFGVTHQVAELAIKGITWRHVK